jgi:hypothetical protein
MWTATALPADSTACLLDLAMHPTPIGSSSGPTQDGIAFFTWRHTVANEEPAVAGVGSCRVHLYILITSRPCLLLPKSLISAFTAFTTCSAFIFFSGESVSCKAVSLVQGLERLG